MNENCKLIWTSEVDVDDWDDYFLEFDPDLDIDERYVRAAEINESYLDDERTNLNIVLGDASPNDRSRTGLPNL